MIIPMHDNRFFSEMAQVFERLARERHWYPIVVSTLRDPALELETVEHADLLPHRYLVVTGATDPDSVSRVCRTMASRTSTSTCPARMATSVISDNYWGAQQLTQRPDRALDADARAARNRPYFVGGLASDYATRRRIDGFARRGAGHASAASMRTRSMPAATRATWRRRPCARSIDRLRGLPRALFVNSTIALEGVVRFLKTLSSDELGAAPSAATTGTRSRAC